MKNGWGGRELREGEPPLLLFMSQHHSLIVSTL